MTIQMPFWGVGEGGWSPGKGKPGSFSEHSSSGRGLPCGKGHPELLEHLIFQEWSEISTLNRISGI